MKLTLLQLVQDVLSDMDGDEVNTIDETVESSQVVSIARRMYYQFLEEHDMKHVEQIFQLEPSTSTALPTHMRLPDAVEKITTVKYNTANPADNEPGPVYQTVCWLNPVDFCERISSRTINESNMVNITDPSGVTFLIRNDCEPTYYTSFDDETLVFDSYDSAVDDTLQNSKTFCHGRVIPAWVNDDTFVPDLPENLWPAYINNVLSRCFHTLKEEANQAIDVDARRGRIKVRRDRFRTNERNPTPNYGRRGYGRQRRSRFHSN